MPDQSSPAKKSKAPPAKEKVAPKKSSPDKGAPHGPKDIEIIHGEDTRILLVAPHGVMGDDDRAGIITREAQDLLKCRAIVNEAFRKRRINFNSLKSAYKHPTFLKVLKEMADAPGHTLVVWIHGADETGDNWKLGIKGSAYEKNIKAVGCLVGWGQGPKPLKEGEVKEKKEKGDDESSFTAKPETVASLCALLTKNGMPTIPTHPDTPNFRGRHPTNMNQWFKKEKYTSEQVESVQLEIRMDGFRSENKVSSTAKIIADALREMFPPLVDAEIVDDETKATELSAPAQNSPPPAKEAVLSRDERALKAFADLKQIVQDHYHGAMLNAGKYIIKEFYGDSIERAKNNEPEHINSLSELYRLIRHQSGDGPSRTWLYDSVNLVVDEHLLKAVRTYGRLGHSHKVLLTHVSDWDTKTQLAEQAIKNDFTVARLREEIKKTNPRSTIYVSVDSVPADETLAQLKPKRLKTLRSELTWHIADKKEKLKQHEADKVRVEKVIEAKPKDKRAQRNIGFRDWTEPACNVNIQTGCSNNCLYCESGRAK